MKKLAFNIMLAASVFATAACDNAKNDSTEQAEEINEENLSDDMEDGAEFAVEAANDGMLEVKLGELAQMNAASQEVKDFAKMMADHHTEVNGDLEALAMQKNIMLPTTMSNDAQEKYNEISEKKGKEFDEAYVDMMVKDHKEDVEKFEELASDGKNADLKAFAAKTLPTLKMHLQKIEAIQSSMN